MGAEEYNQAMKNGAYQAAEESITNLLLDLDSSSITVTELALIYNDRGLARYNQVKFWQAIEDYDFALSICSSEAAIHYNRSTILYRMGDFSKAMAGFKTAVQLKPGNQDFTDGLNACKQALELL